MTEPRVTELRVELPADEVAVLDGYCQASGKHRTAVLRQILAEWSEKKHYEAMLIVRVAGGNPAPPEKGRK